MMSVGGRNRFGAWAAAALVIFSSAAGEAQAQTAWSPGLRGGANLSAVIFGDLASSGVGLKQGWHIGASASRRVADDVSLEVSLLWSQDGYAGDGAHPGNVEMTYVNAPLLARLHLPGRVTPRLTVGLDAAYLVACRITGVHLVDVARCDDPMVGTHWKALDLGGVAGLGWAMGSPSGTFVVDALINLGFRDIKADVLPPGAARRAALRFSVAWFPGGEAVS